MSNEIQTKRIAIFGSTGSIGKQALKFNPNIVVIGDQSKYINVKNALNGTNVKVFAGEKSLEEVAVLLSKLVI